MFEKCVKLIFLMLCLLFSSALSVSAECEHVFAARADKENLFYGIDEAHSYYCLKGCGYYGTADGGVNSLEKCSYRLVSDAKATCTKEGNRFYICKICGRSKYETVPKIKHSYKKIRKLPTCTERGYDLYTCTGCGHAYKDNYVNTLKHISDGGTVEALPDFGKKGLLKISCRVCNCVIERKALPELVRLNTSVGKVKGLKVKSYGTDSVKLSWNKVDGALSYNVTYSTDKKKWKSSASEKTTITIRKLKSSQKYYFRIYAVGTDSQSAPSAVVSVCTKPTKTAFTKVKSTKKSTVNLAWKKLSSVSGYEISYTADSFDKKKTVKTVTITENNKKTIKKLKSGKKYSFRIRVYKNFGSKKIYSAYSKVKTLKIK